MGQCVYDCMSGQVQQTLSKNKQVNIFRRILFLFKIFTELISICLYIHCLLVVCMNGKFCKKSQVYIFTVLRTSQKYPRRVTWFAAYQQLFSSALMFLRCPIQIWSSSEAWPKRFWFQSLRICKKYISVNFLKVLFKKSYLIPMQTRGPSPKGKKAYWWRFVASSFENRSGSNFSGSG